MEMTTEMAGEGLFDGQGVVEAAGVKARARCDQNRYRLQVVDEVLHLLRLMFESDRRMNLADLTAATGMTKNKTFRMLTTMEVRGIIDKDRRGRYHFGVNTFMVARTALTRIELPEALPVLRTLARQLNEEVYLAHRRDGQATLVAVANSKQKVTVRSYLGFPLPDPPGHQSDEVRVGGGLLDPDITTVTIDLPPFSETESGAVVVIAPSFRMSPERVRDEVIPVLRETVRDLGRLAPNSVLRRPRGGQIIAAPDGGYGRRLPRG